jgi:hypothetical protein
LNVENGFPIRSWYDDQIDRELYSIANILEFLAYVPDVREFMRRMVEKNEISYPKAINLINSYNLTVKESQVRSSTPIQTSKNATSIETANKNVKDCIYQYNPYAKANSEKEYPKYTSKIISNRPTEETTNRITPSSMSPNNHAQSKNEENKQINIKIINNNFTHYIINPQETGNYVGGTNNPNAESVNMKKQKGIVNTFRSSYANPGNNINSNNIVNPYSINNENPVNKSHNSQKDPENSKSSVYSGSPNFTPYSNSKYNLKNLNIHVSGVEVKSPVLKSTNYGGNSMGGIHTSKYSSLIDQGKIGSNNVNPNNPNSSRPSSAIILKGRHNRELSMNSLKSDPTLGTLVGSAIHRSPSSQSVINHINRSYSRPNITQKSNIVRQPYMSNIDGIKGINIATGHNTVRPGSNNDRIKINFQMNNHNISNKELKSPNSRYSIDDLVSKRGYSLSSRANDGKTGYKFRENEANKYSSPCKIL